MINASTSARRSASHPIAARAEADAAAPSLRLVPPVRDVAGAKGRDSSGTGDGQAAGRKVPARRTRAQRAQRDVGMLIGATCLLCLIGLIMVLAASTAASLAQYGSPWGIFERQAVYMGAGVVALLVGSRIRVGFWRRMRLVMLFCAFSLLVAVLSPGIGHAAGGSSRWIGAGLIRVQPSELMKFTMVVFAADLVTRREHGLVTWREQWHELLRPLATILLLAAGLIIFQPDMGTAVVLVCIAFGILYAGGVHIRLLSAGGAVAVLGAVIFSMSKPYQRARLLSFIDPVQHLTSGGYQSVQGFTALQTGGVAGTGVGSSGAGWGYLPNAHTDFIFALIGNQLGMIGALTVILLVGLFAWFGFRVAARTTDRFSSLLAAGITWWILCQAIINIGAVIGLLPVTGIPLPFVSYGGSALFVLMLATGILIGIGRRSVLEAFDTGRRRRVAPARAVARPGRVPGGGVAPRQRPAVRRQTAVRRPRAETQMAARLTTRHHHAPARSGGRW